MHQHDEVPASAFPTLETTAYNLKFRHYIIIIGKDADEIFAGEISSPNAVGDIAMSSRAGSDRSAY
jgi:hypothetical protein